MKPIFTVYPDFQEYTCDYQPLIESLEFEILLQVDDNSYQGDTRLILKDGEKYGLLIFGWGSCSGCDALQNCSTVEELDKLRESLIADIVWRDTPIDLLNYILGKSWNLEFSWHNDETIDFLNKAVALLGVICVQNLK